MKKENVKIIKPKKKREEEEKRNWELIAAIITGIIGLILFTNSSKAVIFVCYAIGLAISIFGVYHLISYYRLKKEMNIENNVSLILGSCAVFIGIIVIILASAIETFLRFIIGVVLIISGLNKIMTSIDLRNYIVLTTGIILVAIGLYTILAENIVFAIVGLLLIISSVIDIVKYIKEQKK